MTTTLFSHSQFFFFFFGLVLPIFYSSPRCPCPSPASPITAHHRLNCSEKWKIPFMRGRFESSLDPSCPRVTWGQSNYDYTSATIRGASDLLGSEANEIFVIFLHLILGKKKKKDCFCNCFPPGFPIWVPLWFPCWFSFWFTYLFLYCFFLLVPLLVSYLVLLRIWYYIYLSCLLIHTGPSQCYLGTASYPRSVGGKFFWL